MAKLNAWQRLWVVGIVLLAILLMIAEDPLVPTKESINQQYAGALDIQLRYLVQIKANGNKTDAASQDFLGVNSLADTQARILALETRRQHDLDSLWPSQAKVRLIMSGIWIALSAALYGVGWVIGWVFRGFRPKQA